MSTDTSADMSTDASAPTAPIPPTETAPARERPPGAARHAPHRGKRRRGLARVALLLALVMAVPGASYAQALTAPGSATWQMRTVEWVRDHGGNSLVNAIENWYYTRHAPAGTAPAASALPTWASASPGPGGASVTSASVSPAPIPPLGGAVPLPGEGAWVPGRTERTGAPAVYTTFWRPDAAHPSVVAGAAWFPAGDTTAHLVAGTRQPGGTWPGRARVPDADVPALVATFNSGWKLRDIRGGFYLGGRTSSPLVDGQASAVIDDRGRITVGQWGRDVTMTPHVVAVRQNLDLVVDGGRPVTGLAVNAGGRWGSARNQLQYTWRSGLGIDASGDLIYVAGDHLTLATLAQAMVDAGVVRGMQLDIHPGMASFSSWTPTRNGATPTPTKLLPGMSRSADRYLSADQRDFFYMTLR